MGQIVELFYALSAPALAAAIERIPVKLRHLLLVLTLLIVLVSKVSRSLLGASLSMLLLPYGSPLSTGCRLRYPVTIAVCSLMPLGFLVLSAIESCQRSNPNNP